MQSLILATSLVLSGPASISSLDNSGLLEEMVNMQTQSVSRVISKQTAESAQDNFLFQAKLAIMSVNELAVVGSDNTEMAAE